MLERYAAGVVLTGDQVKSIKNYQVSLTTAYIVANHDCFLVKNIVIPPYKNSSVFNKKTQQKSSEIQLLLRKREMLEIINKSKTKKCEVLPFSVFVLNNWIKIEVF